MHRVGQARGGRAVLDETCHLSVEHHENSTLSLHCCTTVGVSVQLQGAGAARLTGVRPGEIRLNVRPVGPESVSVDSVCARCAVLNSVQHNPMSDVGLVSHTISDTTKNQLPRLYGNSRVTHLHGAVWSLGHLVRSTTTSRRNRAP